MKSKVNASISFIYIKIGYKNGFRQQVNCQVLYNHVERPNSCSSITNNNIQWYILGRQIDYFDRYVPTLLYHTIKIEISLRATNLSKNQLMYASLFIGPLEIPYRLIHSSEGDVGAGNYTNYTLKWPGTLRFVLKPIMGDPDLYISEGKKGRSHSSPFLYFHYYN